MTPIRMANVPPPMALHELKLEDHIVDVAINSITSQVIVLDCTALSIYSYDTSSKQIKHPELVSKHPLPANCDSPSQVSLGKDNSVAIMTHRGDLNQDALYFWSEKGSKWDQFDTGMEHLSTISTSLDFHNLCIQNSAGLVLFASSEFGSLQLRGRSKLPVFCPWTEMVIVGDEVSHH
jgi:elongator complex protein 1